MERAKTELQFMASRRFGSEQAEWLHAPSSPSLRALPSASVRWPKNYMKNLESLGVSADTVGGSDLEAMLVPLLDTYAESLRRKLRTAFDTLVQEVRQDKSREGEAGQRGGKREGKKEMWLFAPYSDPPAPRPAARAIRTVKCSWCIFWYRLVFLQHGRKAARANDETQARYNRK